MNANTRQAEGTFSQDVSGLAGKVAARVIPVLAVVALYCACIVLSDDAAEYMTANAYAFVPSAATGTNIIGAYGKLGSSNDTASSSCVDMREPCDGNAALSVNEPSAMLVSYTSSAGTDLIDVSLDTSNRHLRLAEAFNATRARKQDPALQRIPVVVLN